MNDDTMNPMGTEAGAEAPEELDENGMPKKPAMPGEGEGDAEAGAEEAGDDAPQM